MFVGILLILLGGFFLLRNLDIIPFWYGWQELWPVIIIAVGLSMIADTMFRKSKRKREQ
jgi:phage shock protein C